MNSERKTPGNSAPSSSEWDSLSQQNWDSRLNQDQIDELTAEGITPDTAEYGPALYNFGIKPAEAEPKKPEWDPRLTQEQIDDMVQKGIYEPVGPEYRQALGEFGIKPTGNEDPTGEDNPESDDDDPEKDDDPEEDDDEEPTGEDNPEGDPKKVDIETKLKGPEQEFKEINKERIKELEGKLEKILPNLAELYAKNRRLFVGKANRAEFIKVKGEYGELMDEYMRLKAKENYETGKHEINDRLGTRIEELTKEIEEKLTEFVGGDPENSTKTQEEVDVEKQRLMEEAEKQLRAEYGEMAGALKDKINADFVEDYIRQESKLEDATIDALDNGTLCRKFVHKVLNNKILKGVLVGAAVAGLAVTGVGLAAGLAAGTMTIGLGFTAGGVAAGAAKGALGGTLMSRQDSKNSAVRGFTSEEEIRKNLEDIDITSLDDNTANVTDYLMGQYSEANNSDRKSNRKKTLISAGIGAAIGGFMSGVHINNVETSTQDIRQFADNEPTEYHAANLDNVNIPKGHGAYDTFTQLGGRPEDYSKFQDIMFKLDPKYGLVPGSNGETAGLNGLVGNFAHTYPGTINTWPDAAQSYITEVANEAARQGLIPGFQTGGAPIYNTITQIVTKEVPNAFMNFLARATAAAGIGVIGNKIGGSGSRNTESTPSEASPEDETIINVDTPEGPDMYVDGEWVRENGSESSPAETEQSPESNPENESTSFEEIINEESETEAPSGEQLPEDNIVEQINKQLKFRQQVEDSLGSLVGDSGVEIVSERGDYLADPAEFNTRIETWWNNLDDTTKDAVRSFERGQADSDLGKPLRNWLSSKGEL